jgi:hypothetical protein
LEIYGNSSHFIIQNVAKAPIGHLRVKGFLADTFAWKTRQGKYHSGQCLPGKCICWKISSGEIYLRANVSAVKCLPGKFSEQMSPGKIYIWANVTAVKCFLGKFLTTNVFWANVFQAYSPGKCRSGKFIYEQMYLRANVL